MPIKTTILLLIALAMLMQAQLVITGPSTCKQNTTCAFTASGGTPPYPTWQMVSGSLSGTSVVGSGTNNAIGTLTTPTHITVAQTLNGCMAFPGNSIFNTAIAALPVNTTANGSSTNSAVWMSNMDINGVFFGAGEQMEQNAVLSTDPTKTMQFTYTPTQNGPFIFPSDTTVRSEAGLGITIQQESDIDNHFLVTYKDTCKHQENYQLYPGSPSGGFHSVDNNGGNSQSGVLYDLTSFAFPAASTAAGGGPLTPLVIRQDEITAAAAGNLHAIKHAIRLTMDAASINRSNTGSPIWPGTASNGSNGCQGNGLTVSTSGVAVTWLADPSGNGMHFRTQWPTGMTVTINSVNYTISSVTDTTHLTLNTSAGTQPSTTLVQPNTNCAPYGAFIRLKSTYTWPGFDGVCATTGCQNIVNAEIWTMQNYGFFLNDIGTNWNADVEGSQGVTNDFYNSAREVKAILSGSPTNFEIPDQSTLQTNQAQNGQDPQWFEAKLGNAFVTPANAAVIEVTDSASNHAFFSVALQGVVVGVQNATETVMAGASPIQFSPWVTGASNTGFTCSLSPSGGANGTITTGCLYTPASAGSVASRTITTVTVTSSADATVSNSFSIVILPTSTAPDGGLYISLGKAGFGDYSDGIRTWYSDGLNTSPPLFPSNAFTINGGGGTWTGTNTGTSSGIYTQQLLATFNDFHADVWVGSGSHTVTFYLANIGFTSVGNLGYSLDCNGTPALPITDIFTATGVQFGTAALSCTVNTSHVQATVRMQAVNTQGATGPPALQIVNPCCTANTQFYTPHYGNLPVELAGLTVSAAQASSGSIMFSGIHSSGVIH